MQKVFQPPQCPNFEIQGVFYWPSLKSSKYKKVNLGQVRTIYVNVDTPNLGFTYLNFLGGLYGGYGIFNGMVGILWLYGGYIYGGALHQSAINVSPLSENSHCSAQQQCSVQSLFFSFPVENVHTSFFPLTIYFCDYVYKISVIDWSIWGEDL